MNQQPNPTPSFTPYTFPPKKPAYIFTRTELWLALALWVVGYFYVSTIPVNRHPILAFGTWILLLVGTVCFLRHPSQRTPDSRATPWAWVLTGVGVALSLSYLWSVNRALQAAVAVWNALSWFYLVFLLTGNSREHFPGKHFVGEMFTSLATPFRAPSHLFAALFGTKKNPDGTPSRNDKVRRTVGWVLVGLVLAVIPTMVVSLLLSYDEGFSRVMESIWDTIFSADTLFRQVRNIAIGLLVGALLFGAVLAGKNKTVKPQTLTYADIPGLQESLALPPRDGVRFLPVSLVAGMLTPIMVIYVIFFVSQWDYYVSAFTGVRPEELTFSTYAREGFFQLVVVALINAGLSLGAGLFAKRRPEDPDRPKRTRTSPVLRIYLAVLSLMTLVLIATALSKMFLYVDTYGMTHKRVYATWLMLLLAVAFVAVILRQMWSRLNLTGALVTIFLVFFLAISLLPVDALIVRYNVNVALDGNLRTMQGDVCEDSGAAGVLAALDFMEATADPAVAAQYDPAALAEVRTQTQAYLEDMANELGQMKWDAHNITTLRAKEALTRRGYGDES